MPRYNFISDNDVEFVNNQGRPAQAVANFRGADLNYLACKYAIHRRLNPPSATLSARTADIMADHFDEEEHRSTWLDRLFQRLATLGEAQRPQG